jgi:dTDP-4-dehydrorhamnose 3,5-epimerase
MRLTRTAIPDVIVIEPKLASDARGVFFESFNLKSFRDNGLPTSFVQDNQSKSRRNVLRGLHYQIENVQGKLIRAVAGGVFDVAVDLRKSSPTFGKWVSETLSEENKKMIWIPPGFAHGFLATTENAVVVYKVTDFYLPSAERTIIWDDQDLKITWPIEGEPVLSDKDLRGVPFRSAEIFP